MFSKSSGSSVRVEPLYCVSVTVGLFHVRYRQRGARLVCQRDSYSPKVGSADEVRGKLHLTFCAYDSQQLGFFHSPNSLVHRWTYLQYVGLCASLPCWTFPVLALGDCAVRRNAKWR